MRIETQSREGIFLLMLNNVHRRFLSETKWRTKFHYESFIEIDECYTVSLCSITFVLKH